MKSTDVCDLLGCVLMARARPGRAGRPPGTQPAGHPAGRRSGLPIGGGGADRRARAGRQTARMPNAVPSWNAPRWTARRSQRVRRVSAADDADRARGETALTIRPARQCAGWLELAANLGASGRTDKIDVFQGFLAGPICPAGACEHAAADVLQTPAPRKPLCSAIRRVDLEPDGGQARHGGNSQSFGRCEAPRCTVAHIESAQGRSHRENAQA